MIWAYDLISEFDIDLPRGFAFNDDFGDLIVIYFDDDFWEIFCLAIRLTLSFR
ncbi:hypothetical protein RchiOBHm_Chr7g0243651 [Rosa chinensis]|uniref:Uncharacterized protein n=1 Tax=Rosa chinensis TaxID=74649 RepID=A0A2P6PIT3_ROSCH|nr:hypothetical protein RchiOBHm_Chr7g0243651 [Rosa chinensis]